MKTAVVLLLGAGLAACATAPRPTAPAPEAAVAAPPVAVAPAAPSRCTGVSPYAPAQEDTSKRGDYVAGGLFRPGERDRIPGAIPDVECIPEPTVEALPRSKLGNRPVYTVLDREYRVLDDTRGFAEEGLASYYGEKFHGRRTSNWEVYDMYAFTAAHKTLPLPSFARVTNLENGRSIVVRVNDRGPFHDGRVVDLSFAAAIKLGVYPAGTGRVRVEALQPDQPLRASATPPQPAAPARGGPAPVAVAAVAQATPGQASEQYRFRMGESDAPATAEQFDAWMDNRGVRVATGQPAPVARGPGTSAAPEPDATVAIAPLPAPVARPPAGGAIALQVASFSDRGNAERAMARLAGTGLGQPRVVAGESGGREVWRVRVDALNAGAADELTARLPGLGFGRPMRLSD